MQTYAEVRQGKSTEWNRIPFPVESNNWVQVELNVKASAVTARVKTLDGGWKEIGTVVSPGRTPEQSRHVCFGQRFGGRRQFQILQSLAL